MTELLKAWDGAVATLFAVLVFMELREFRKSLARLVELLARQDERSQMHARQTPQSGRSRRDSYMTLSPRKVQITPPHGVPIPSHIGEDEDG